VNTEALGKVVTEEQSKDAGDAEDKFFEDINTSNTISGGLEKLRTGVFIH
jgi:hypothetical protein